MFWQKYQLEVAVFVCGAVVMIFELAGSRVLGPFFGTSIFVWTSLIGIILGSLSYGYHIGGKLADKKPGMFELSIVIFASAASVALMIVIKDPLLILLQANIKGYRLGPVLASVILFAPGSILLGMISPYAARLKIKDLAATGRAIGNLYALSTAGSIFGTFIAGFYLIPTFGTNRILQGLALTLLLLSLVLNVNGWFRTKIGLLLFIIVVLPWLGNVNVYLHKSNFIDLDTAYNRIWVYNQLDKKTNRPTKVLGINNENHSSMYLDGTDLVNTYTKYYHLIAHFNPEFSNSLMIGGAGYSFSKDYLLQYPKATMDVVEIDPMMTTIAKQYFQLKDDARLNSYHQDGRIFLNQNNKKYDAIFGDAFGSRYSIPFQLTTREAVQKMYNGLTDNGVAIVNIISAIEGKNGKFLRAEYRTYAEIFPHVLVLPVKNWQDGYAVQNLILIALKSPNEPLLSSANQELNEFISHRWQKPISSDMPILTDDYAPVDDYISEFIS
ncbi:MAG: fused MFS/spermidine synthase [Candidatus Falkowbacteria bacterium]